MSGNIIRLVFKYNNGTYEGTEFTGEVEDLQDADVILCHPPDNWIRMEEKDKIGKIIPVSVIIKEIDWNE